MGATFVASPELGAAFSPDPGMLVGRGRFMLKFLPRRAMMSATLLSLAMVMGVPSQTLSPDLRPDLRPELRTVRPPSRIVPQISPQLRRQRQIADARALLARAEATRANYVPAAGGPTREELDRAAADARAELESMSEMGEMDSLRLQMAMDRLSKMMSTLSNLLKKISDTQAGIVQNLR